MVSSRLSQRFVAFFFVLSVHSFYYSAVFILVHLLNQLTLHNFGNSPKEIPEIPAPRTVSLNNKYRLFNSQMMIITITLHTFMG